MIEDLPPLRRSLLYVAGDAPEVIAAARRSPADVVCLDLEDNVAPENKGKARRLVAEALRMGGFAACEVIVRINAVLPAEQAQDLAMLAGLGHGSVMVPKVSAVADLEPVLAGLKSGEGPRLWAMIETARGLICCEAVAAHPQVTALVVGAGDLAGDLRIPLADAPQAMQLYGPRIVTAARAAGRTALEGITSSPDDPNPCGFDGRTTYPGQDVAAINRAFSPTEQEVAHARYALEARYAHGDHLHYARRTLALAERSALREAELAALLGSPNTVDPRGSALNLLKK